jgi:hypothetical protein
VVIGRNMMDLQLGELILKYGNNAIKNIVNYELDNGYIFDSIIFDVKVYIEGENL